MLVQVVLLVLFGSSLTLCRPSFPGESDLVKSLPGVPFSIPYKQYSGYLELEDSIKFHYWLFESQSNPESDPVVQWFNGGPTASGLFGAFTELGPIRVQPNGTITANPYAWNLKANLLVIESPVGIGFSYKPGDDNYPNNDSKTGELNLQAIRQFFVKFPHLLKNPFYITGESYAGRYIPYYSVLALEAKFPPNFKGVAIGNGYLDPRHSLEDKFEYYHGINGGVPNPYNILADCVVSLLRSDLFLRVKPQSSSGFLPSCDGSRFLAKWLNRRDVRDALHIDANYTREWVGLGGAPYEWGGDSMATKIKTMIDAGLKVIIYNGDLDSMCDFVTDRAFTENLGYKELSFESWSALDDTVGGFMKTFEKNLVFTTVRGAGHMVPMDKPAAALKLINGFLLGV